MCKVHNSARNQETHVAVWVKRPENNTKQYFTYGCKMFKGIAKWVCLNSSSLVSLFMTYNIQHS